MTQTEILKLLDLLRKFYLVTGYNILDIEMKVISHGLSEAKTKPVFEMREGVHMDEKMAYEHDMQRGEDKAERYEERERQY